MRRRRFWWYGLGLVSLALVGTGGFFLAGGGVVGAPKEGTQVGNLAPNFTLYDLKGKKVTLSDFRGKNVFLNFWATWCPPCRGEMPDIEGEYREALKKKKNIVFFAVNIQEDKEKVSKFIKDNEYTFPVLLDRTGVVARQYLVTGIPTTYFLDEKGIIRNKVVGGMDARRIAKEIESLLAHK